MSNKEIKPGHPVGGGHIILKVYSQHKNEVFFRIKRSAPLKELMNAYCEFQSVDYNSFMFIFDGRHLRREQTPDELGMVEGDEIYAMLHCDGPQSAKEGGTTSNEETKHLSGGGHITLKVLGVGVDGNIVFLRMKRSAQLKKLMNRYCELQSKDYDFFDFLFDRRGLHKKRTPGELAMEEDDEIQSMLNQRGC